MKQGLSISRLHPGWIALMFFLCCGLRRLDLPGLYMDAVNPDYLAAHALYPGLNNFSFLLPGSNMPMVFLGNYYHGVQNYYLAWLFLGVFGTSVVNIRLAQMVLGCVIVLACTTLVMRLTRSRTWALVCGLGLATDIAFVSSFRNQNYIVLGGLAWLCISLLLLVPKHDRAPGPRRVFASGVLSGLAAYGYFVQIFFYPAMLGFVAARARPRWRSLAIWCAGVAVGLLPYVCGYLSMYHALGSFAAFKASVMNGLAGLHPTDAASNLIERTIAASRYTQSALSGDEGAMMAFWKTLPDPWGDFKPYLFAAAILVALMLWMLHSIRHRSCNSPLQLAWLPVSFFLTAATLFGKRLGAHHFSVMIPLLYVLLAVLLATACAQARHAGRWVRWLPVLTMLILVTANVWQQGGYMRELDRTGGVGRSSSAMTTMAQDAWENGGNDIYVFPDWGFFTSFVLLTENRVPYIVDAAPSSLSAAAKAFPQRRQFRTVFWSQNDAARYADAMRSAGVTSITERVFRQRDGRIAFHMLEGRMMDTAGAPR